MAIIENQANPAYELADPRRMGGNSVDYEERINYERMRKERLQRLQAAIAQHDLGALLLYNPGNIRYATSTRFLTNFTNVEFQRCALVPREGEPLLFEIIGVEMRHRKLNSPWIADRLRPHTTWTYTGPAEVHLAHRWAKELKEALKELGVAGEKIGLDRIQYQMLGALEAEGIKFVDAWPVCSTAKITKTRDEIECFKQIAAIHDAAFEAAHEVIRPGVRESDVAAEIAGTLFREGAEYIICMVVASGGHTNPYLREHTDKMIRAGDLVTIDFNSAGPGGYLADYVRTFLCGNKATKQQRELYKECYDTVYGAITACKDGVMTDVVASEFPEYDDDVSKTWSMVQFGHGLGISFYEEPTISRGHSLQYPVQLKENMVLAFETYAGREGGREGVRLEENIVVTKNGFEYLSLYPLEEKLTDLTQPLSRAELAPPGKP